MEILILMRFICLDIPRNLEDHQGILFDLHNYLVLIPWKYSNHTQLLIFTIILEAKVTAKPFHFSDGKFTTIANRFNHGGVISDDYPPE